MRLGTTPTHIFEVPLTQEELLTLKEIEIVYHQGDDRILRKTKEHCAIADGIIRVDLTQEETFLFDCLRRVKIQIRVKTSAGSVLSSDIIRKSPYECLSKEVL
jgi:hypothetical protein